MKKNNQYVIAAGGTGGHFFPALATAEKLQALGHRVTILTDKRTAHYAKDKCLNIIPLTNRSFSGGIFNKFISLFFLGIGFLQALIFLISNRPNKVIGFGGYPSFPGIMAAIILRIPIILHDQNAIIGRVNKYLGRFASQIALAYPLHFMKKHNQLSDKMIYVGSPIRDIFLQAKPNQVKLTNSGKIQLFIFGGSQGASIFSKMLPQMIKTLPESLKIRLQIIQQVREEDNKHVQAFYKKEKITAEIKPFFKNMDKILIHSHLVIARAGASSIAEILATQTPAIYIPLPSSKDNHQFYNATYACENLKAGWLIDQKEIDTLTVFLEEILTNFKQYNAIKKQLALYQHKDSLIKSIVA